MYTEVIQDSVIDLINRGKVKFASSTSLTVSRATLAAIYANLTDYRHRLLLRPQEISNQPEIIRRLGTSPAQFYRLIDPTNYRKTVDKMLLLLQVLDCEVDVVVRQRSA